MRKYTINIECYNHFRSHKKNIENFSYSEYLNHGNLKALMNNSSHFFQNKSFYYGYKKINDNNQFFKSLKSSNVDLFFLIMFHNANKIYSHYKNKTNLQIDFLNQSINLDFNNPFFYNINNVSFEFCDNTFIIHCNNDGLIQSLFYSFYNDEMYCYISKNELRKNLNKPIITEVIAH